MSQKINSFLFLKDCYRITKYDVLEVPDECIKESFLHSLLLVYFYRKRIVEGILNPSKSSPTSKTIRLKVPKNATKEENNEAGKRIINEYCASYISVLKFLEIEEAKYNQYIPVFRVEFAKED